jgi:hypothetical protein
MIQGIIILLIGAIIIVYDLWTKNPTFRENTKVFFKFFKLWNWKIIFLPFIFLQMMVEKDWDGCPICGGTGKLDKQLENDKARNRKVDESPSSPKSSPVDLNYQAYLKRLVELGERAQGGGLTEENKKESLINQKF